MSKTYKSLDTQLVHALWKSDPPSSSEQVVIYAWCGTRYEVSANRYTCGVCDEPGLVVTCMRCLGKQANGHAPRQTFRDALIANSVKDFDDPKDETCWEED